MVGGSERSPDGVGLSLETALARFETDLGLRSGLLFRILRDKDDWSFIIKCHALVESTASDTLTRVLDSRLSDRISAMPLGNKSSGKLSLLSALDLVDGPTLGFIMRLGELRNDVVHDVRRVEFAFPEHLAGLDHNQKRGFHSLCSFYCLTYSAEDRAKWADRRLTEPRIPIYMGALKTIFSLRVRSSLAELSRSETAMLARIGRLAEEQAGDA